MSHFTTVRTQMKNREALVRALRSLGFSAVEVHSIPQHLYGYVGDVRPQKAEIIVRRQYISMASNDIGFSRQKDGTFKATISEYDQGIGYNAEWLGRLSQQYAYEILQEHIRSQRYAVVRQEVQQDGSLRLLLRRFS